MNTNKDWLDIASAPKKLSKSVGENNYGASFIGFSKGSEPYICRWWWRDGSPHKKCNFITDSGLAVYPDMWRPLPAAPCSHASTVATEGEKDDITQRLRDNADLDAAEDGNPAVIRLEREAADEIDRLRRALADAPAAGDSLDSERLDFLATHGAWIAWSRDGDCCRVFHVDSGGQDVPICGWGAGKNWLTARDAIDAAIAQQSQRKEA